MLVWKKNSPGEDFRLLWLQMLAWKNTMADMWYYKNCKLCQVCLDSTITESQVLLFNTGEEKFSFFSTETLTDICFLCTHGSPQGPGPLRESFNLSFYPFLAKEQKSVFYRSYKMRGNEFESLGRGSVERLTQLLFGSIVLCLSGWNWSWVKAIWKKPVKYTCDLFVL